MSKFEPIKSSKQALKESRALRSYWSHETRLSQRILIYCAELLEGIQRKHKKRPLTHWQKFFSAECKKGLGLKAIAAEWQKKKGPAESGGRAR